MPKLTEHKAQVVSRSGAPSAREMAQRLHGLGVNVLPVRPGEKRPAISWKEFQSRRITGSELQELFPNGVKSGVYIVCGRVSLLVVIDCDSPAAIEYWRERLGPVFDKTTRVKTSKGSHYYFRLRPDQLIESWAVHSGDVHFEVQSEGKGVVAPPSVHESGHAYYFEVGLDHLQDAPDAIAKDQRDDPPPVGRESRGLAALLADKPDVGERDVWLARVGGHLAHLASHEDAYLALLHEVNDNLPEPLPREQVESKAGIWRIEQTKHATPVAEREDYKRELDRQRVRNEVARRLRQEEALADFVEPPSRFTLVEELQLPEPPVEYAVEGLLVSGGNAVLIAEYKTGKTTLMVNLVRALADGEPFLGRYRAQLEGRVAIFNFEMTDAQFRRWLRSAGVSHPERVAVLNLREYRLPLDADVAAEFMVRWLSEREVTFLILDPYARAFSGDENDNTEVRRFLETLDELKRRAGVREVVLPVHTGRAEMAEGRERARGATRLDDWNDSRWLLTRARDGEARFFAAHGRDVDVSEGRLDFDPDTLRLSLGEGNRRSSRLEGQVEGVVEAATKEPGINTRMLRAAVGGKHDEVDAACREAVRRGLVRRQGGMGRNRQGVGYFPTGTVPAVPTVPELCPGTVEGTVPRAQKGHGSSFPLPLAEPGLPDGARFDEGAAS